MLLFAFGDLGELRRFLAEEEGVVLFFLELPFVPGVVCAPPLAGLERACGVAGLDGTLFRLEMASLFQASMASSRSSTAG